MHQTIQKWSRIQKFFNQTKYEAEINVIFFLHSTFSLDCLLSACPSFFFSHIQYFWVALQEKNFWRKIQVSMLYRYISHNRIHFDKIFDSLKLKEFK